MNFIDTHPIGQIFNLGHQKVVWKKVTEIKIGQKIAVVGAGFMPAQSPIFDEIVSIKKIDHEQVYDIEVEGTHNFVANGIIAHNTFISGSVGIGTSSPLYPLHVGTTASDQLSGYFAGYIAAQKFIDLDNYANYYLDLANASDTSASLALERSGSIRFNSVYNVGATNWQYIQNGPAIKIQSLYDAVGANGGLFLAAATIGTSASNIGTTWGDSGLFISAKAGSTGNVGIGTTNPGYKLEVVGDALVSTRLGIGSTNALYDLNVGNTASFNNLHISGNVGIGTTGPNALLHLDTTGTGTTISTMLRLENEANGGGGQIYSPALDFVTSNSNINARVYATREGGTGGNLVLQTATTGGTLTDRVYIKNDGNVGIGTTAPTDKLNIVTTTAYGGLTLESTLASSYQTALNFKHPNGTTYGRVGFDQNTDSMRLMNLSTWTGAGADILFYTNNDTTTPKMAISRLGNVGIGTTAPGSKLVVAGAASILGTSNGAEVLNLGTAGLINAVINTGDEMFFNIDSDNNQTGASFHFGHNLNTSSATELMRIQDNGNVGIGTTGPASKLDVVGIASGYETIAKLKGGTSTGSLQIYGDNFNNDTGVMLIQATAGLVLDGANGTGQMYLKSDGNVGIGTTSPNAQLSLSKYMQFGNTLTASAPTCDATNEGVMLYNRDNTSERGYFYNCYRYDGDGTYKWGYFGSGGNGYDGTPDYAEYIKVNDSSTSYGDIVAIGTEQTITAVKSNSSNPQTLLGIISTDPGIVLGTDGDTVGPDKNTKEIMWSRGYRPLALSGRVPAKVMIKNNQILSGDSITTSGLSGVGQKATQAGQIVAKTLEPFNPNPASCQSVNSLAEINWEVSQDKTWTNTGTCYQLPDGTLLGKVMVFVNVSWYDPDVYLTSTGQVTVDYNVSPEVLASLGYSDTKNEIENAIYSNQINTGLVKTINLIADNIVAKKVITPEIKTTTITPLDEITDTIVIDGNLKAKEASFSSVYADQIINKDGNITDVMTQKIADLRAEITNLMTASASATPSAIAQAASTWDTSVATSSATLDVTNMTISDSLIIGANLIVNGQTNLSKLYVSDTFAIGQIAVKDNIIETTANQLFIQPSGIGSINFLNSRLIVSDDGTVTVNAKLAGTDATFSGSLVANMLEADSARLNSVEAAVANIGKINIATDSANLIVAIGSSTPQATSSATISTNASAGTSILPAGTTELKIENSKIENSSMVYLTPNGSTQNQTIYIKSKDVRAPLVGAPSSFTIGIDSTLPADLSINWWIIN